jgi:hypothetical protein
MVGKLTNESKNVVKKLQAGNSIGHALEHTLVRLEQRTGLQQEDT